jgi:hypothetical protein
MENSPMMALPVRLSACLLVAAFAAAVPSRPAFAQAGGRGDNLPNFPEDQPRYPDQAERPRCHHVRVRVYDEARGRSVTRSRLVCDERRNDAD